MSQRACGERFPQACASVPPLAHCFDVEDTWLSLMGMSDGWAGDLGRVRPNPCVAPGTRINIAQVIAHALLRIKSQLSGKLWSSMTRTAKDTVTFLECGQHSFYTAGSQASKYCYCLSKGSPSLVYTACRQGWLWSVPTTTHQPTLVWHPPKKKHFKWMCELWEGCIFKITFRIKVLLSST